MRILILPLCCLFFACAPRLFGGELEDFTKAAANGNVVAQTHLGIMYLTGRGVPQDYAKAVELFQKAAAQGDAKAQALLGVMYEHGRGVPRDDARAYAWYSLAAAQGQANVAEMRDTLEAKMTPAQLAAAQKLSSELLAKMPKR